MRPFPPGFFDRSDPTPDDRFDAVGRLVTHIDANAIATVGARSHRDCMDDHDRRRSGVEVSGDAIGTPCAPLWSDA
jgi:hypothetical protein